MKIKRFLAPDMRTALQHVRQEHGPDAVILSNRVTAEGVEIVAASQYDEDLVRDAAETTVTATSMPASALATAEMEVASHIQTPSADDEGTKFFTPSVPVLSQPESTTDAMESTKSTTLAALLAPASPTPAVPAEPAAPEPPMPSIFQTSTEPMSQSSDSAPILDDIKSPVVATSPVETVAAGVTASADTDISAQLREEFAQMRQMIERGLNRMTDERLRSSPARQQLMDWMDEQGFTSGLIREVALGIPAETALHRIQAQTTTILGELLPISSSNFLDEGGTIALIGPSGAGKTSTIGKLAAWYSARHGVRDIALISLDHARPGGSDRLYCLARQLGIAAHEADSSQALAALLQRLQDYRVVLIDSPGVTPRHPKSAEQLDWLREVGGVRSLLVLPANTHHVDLDDVVNRFQPVGLEGVIVTRLDETRRPGGVLSVLSERKLPLAWVSDGQHLHDDLHRADVASLLQRLKPMTSEMSSSYDPVEALVAKHAFA